MTVPADNDQTIALVRYDAACSAVAEAKTVDEAKIIRDEALRLKAYARQANNRDLLADVTEIQMRAELRVGELMEAQRQTEGLATGREGKRKSLGLPQNPSDKPTLAEAGIDKNLAHRARTMARLPKAEQEKVIKETREAIKSSPRDIRPAHKSKEKSIPLADANLLSRIVKKFGDGSEVSVRKIASKALGNVVPTYVADQMKKLAAKSGDGYCVEKVSGTDIDAVWRIARLEETLVQPIEPTKAEKRAKPERALPDKKYGVILADLEWILEQRSGESGTDRAADGQYPTSTTEVIAARDVPSLAAADCVLFLRTTSTLLLDALRLMAEWGFQYREVLISHMKLEENGYWFINQFEIVLVGTKGDPAAPLPGTEAPEPGGEHRAKPESTAEAIGQLWPKIPKIELNRRDPAHPGWDAGVFEASTTEPAAADADEPAS